MQGAPERIIGPPREEVTYIYHNCIVLREAKDQVHSTFPEKTRLLWEWQGEILQCWVSELLNPRPDEGSCLRLIWKIMENIIELTESWNTNVKVP